MSSLNTKIYFNGFQVSGRDLKMDCSLFISHEDAQGREIWGEELPEEIDFKEEMTSAYEVVDGEFYEEERLVESIEELRHLILFCERLKTPIEKELELIRSGKRQRPTVLLTEDDMNEDEEYEYN